jgi:chromosome segregation ATPase
MAEDEELEQVNHLVPSDTKQEAAETAEWGELSDAVRSVYEAFARSGGDVEVARLRAELERTKVEMESVEEQLDKLSEEHERLEERKSELERRLEGAESEALKYESIIDEIVHRLDSGESVWKGHGLVGEAAESKGIARDKVMSEIKERRPELPEERFTEGKTSGVSFEATKEAE